MAWDFTDAVNEVATNVREDTEKGLVGGIVAGAFVGGPGGVIGMGLAGAGLAFVTSLVWNAGTQAGLVSENLSYTSSGGFSWSGVSYFADGGHAFSPVGNPLNNSDGSVTQNIRFNDGMTASLNVTRGTLAINGTAGNDIWEGKAGNDTFNGKDGNDNMTGHQNADYLAGGNGGDILNGGSGKDKLIGNADHDLLTGGIGEDVFYFATTHAAKDSDKITDFELGIDEIADVEHINGWDTVTEKGVVYATSFTTDYGNEIELKTRMGLGYHDWSAAKMNEVLNSDSHHMFG